MAEDAFSSRLGRVLRSLPGFVSGALTVSVLSVYGNPHKAVS